MQSLIRFFAILFIASANVAEAATLRFQSITASASVSYDGIGVSDQGNDLIEVLDPEGSTFALVDPDTGTIRVRALASEAGRMSASALGNIQIKFRAEGGPIAFAEGAFTADFDSVMTRTAVLGVETLGGAAQTVAQHQASVLGGTQGSGLGALIDVTDYVGFPFLRIIEPNPVAAGSGAAIEWSANHMTSSLSSRAFELDEGRTLTISLAFRAAANISERGLADSDGSHTASFSFALPETVSLADVPQSYTWIGVSTVPLPGAFVFLMTGLGGLSLACRRRSR